MQLLVLAFFSDKSFKRLIIDRRKLFHALSGFINEDQGLTWSA